MGNRSGIVPPRSPDYRGVSGHDLERLRFLRAALRQPRPTRQAERRGRRQHRAAGC